MSISNIVEVYFFNSITPNNGCCIRVKIKVVVVAASDRAVGMIGRYLPQTN